MARGTSDGVEDESGRKRKRESECAGSEEDESSRVERSSGVEIDVEELEQLRDFLKKKLSSLLENERT